MAKAITETLDKISASYKEYPDLQSLLDKKGVEDLKDKLLKSESANAIGK